MLICRRLFALLLCLFTVGSAMAAPPPAIEYSSLLDGVRVRFRGIKPGEGGRLEFGYKGPANGVFVPNGAKMHVSLFRKGSKQPLVTYRCPVMNNTGIWRQVPVSLSGQEFKFEKEGAYRVTYFINGQPATSVDFSIRFLKSDDPFEPHIYTIVDGPWNKLAYLHVYKDEVSNGLQFNIWTRKISKSDLDQDTMSIQLFRGEELVAVTTDKKIAWPEWLRHEASFTFPRAQGGRVFRVSDLLKVDGKYRVTAKLNGKLYGHYSFEVADGAIKPHERQVMGYKPTDQWLVPKKLSVGLDGAGSVFWLDRSQKANAAAAPKAAAKDPLNTKQWQVTPDADPQRPFQVVHTKIPTRHDTPIAAGNGIVAFATGSSRGVAYLRTGENKQQSIPNGQQYRADLIAVCGKKIVLANYANLFVFDTETERTHAIPDSDVHMRYQKGALYGPRLLDADGYLVVTTNDPTSVRDRNVIKVLDLSGAEPQIIPIRNTGFTVSDVSSVKVSARHGYVALGSSRQQAIFVAPVRANATFKKYDISGYDSFGEMDMALTDHYIAYLDKAGFAHLRVLDLETGDVKTLEMSEHGGSWGTTVASNGNLITWPTKEPRSTFVVSEYAADPKLLGGSTSKVSEESNYGKFGFGSSAVISRSGTLFLAGSGSISHQRCLQMSVDGKWVAVPGPDGKPLPAIDVVRGDAMIAFKTGKPSTSGLTTISYATYGEQIEGQPRTAVAANDSVSSPDTTGSARSANGSTVKETKENPYFTKDEQDETFLNEVLKNEQILYKAIKGSVGDATARKQAIGAAVRTLQNTENKHLVDEYKRRSTLIPADEKPAAPKKVATPTTGATSNAGISHEGEWQAIRVVVNGREPIADSVLETVHFTMKNGEYRVVMGQNVETGTYKIDTSKTPAHISITPGVGPLKGMAREGIFKLSNGGEQLITVFATSGARPHKFSATARSQAMMSVYKRVK